MADTSILVDILATLNRLDARLQEQDARLDGIVHSSSTSAVGSSSPATMPTSFCDDDDEQRRGAEPRKHAIMTAQAYQASVMKLRRRLFDFDSRSELAVGKNGDDNDAYTASVYPSRPLPRLDILDSCSGPTAAPPPPRPGSAAGGPALNDHDTGSSCRPFSSSSAPSLASPSAAVSPATTFASQRSSSSRWTSWRGKAPIIAGNIRRRLATRSSRSPRSSRSSQASTTTSSSSTKHGGDAKAGGGGRRNHERVGMALYAYDNFF